MCSSTNHHACATWWGEIELLRTDFPVWIMVIINIPRTTEAGRIRYSCLVNKKTSGGANHQTELFWGDGRCWILDGSSKLWCFGGEFHHIFQNAQWRMCPAGSPLYIPLPEKCQTEPASKRPMVCEWKTNAKIQEWQLTRQESRRTVI